MTRKFAAVVLLLGCAPGCEYDARITVNPPDWAADPANAVQVVAVQPETCAPGDPLRVAFTLGDDRDDAIVPGVDLELTDGTVTITEAEVAGALADVTLTPVAGGSPTVEGEVALDGVAWVPAESGALALAVEASSSAAAADPGDQRLLAADAVARAYLVDPTRRLAVWALADGEADERLTPTADVIAATEAIDGIAFAQGGDAPLLDGAVAAAAGVRTISTAGGSILLIGGPLDDRGSSATASAAGATLAAQPPVALSVVAVVDDPVWRDLACRSGGGYAQAADPSGLSGASSGMVRATIGRWQGRAARAIGDGLPAGSYRLDGTLRITIGGDTRSVPLSAVIDLD